MGFSGKEKDELKKMGAKYVYLIGCDDKGTEYVDYMMMYVIWKMPEL